MAIVRCPSSYLRLLVVLFPLDFATSPLPGVSHAPSHLVMPLCLHTMRVKLLLLVSVGTHICMCLSTHVYACSTCSHASMQQRKLPLHRCVQPFFTLCSSACLPYLSSCHFLCADGSLLSAKICPSDAVPVGLPSETASNNGRNRDLVLVSPSA